ncbi:hypothetical protein KPL70_025944 [Citrus sinensis]|nr:hypothetical protein KPL70_025944 [Citrus sinensis]
MQESGEVVSESESDGGEMPQLIDASGDDEVEYPTKGESLVAMRALSTQMRADDMEQYKEIIFHTRCIVNSKVCSIIIDGGSCTNVSITTLVEKLGLPLLTHPRPYRLQWLNDCGEVQRQSVIMEWMDSVMVTRLLSLSHIVAYVDAAVSGRDTPQLVDTFLHQLQTCAVRWRNIVKFHKIGFENGGDRCIMDEDIRMRVSSPFICLKHVFIASLPSELQPDLQRKLTATNLSIADISRGKIFQMVMLSLDKICEQKEFFKDLMEDKKPFSKACKKPYLKIECKDEKKCVCPTTKKRHFRKHFHRKSSSKKPFRYFKKKDVSQYRKKKSNRCFICKKRGHFARNYPHKSAKVVRLIQHLQQSSLLSENEDVDSNFSEQSAQDDQTVFLIAESSDSEDISVISTVQNVNHVSTIPRPSLKMSILPSKFHKPVPVIEFIDTGADTSMIDPSVLPSDYWERHSKLFRAVNGETFETTLITKKLIGIQF